MVQANIRIKRARIHEIEGRRYLDLGLQSDFAVLVDAGVQYGLMLEVMNQTSPNRVHDQRVIVKDGLTDTISEL